MDLWSEKVTGIITQVILVLFSAQWVTRGEVCHRSLVGNRPSSSFRSSSQVSGSHGPEFAKLNRREGAGGWSPLTSDTHQWLEVDLGERLQVTAVSTQGRYGSSDWLTVYLLMFSDTGHNWRQYRQEDSVRVFPGNSNADSVVLHKLQHAVIARYIRIVPLDWNPSGRIGLRLETYGCPYASDVVGFDGSSSLLYSLSPWWKPATTDSISLKFKTLRNSGVLLHMEGQSENSLSLQLHGGKLLLLLQKGEPASPDGRYQVSLGSLLDDQYWHHVTMERRGARLDLTVDNSAVWVQMPHTYTRWDHDQMSVGATHAFGSQWSAGSYGGFNGCLENLSYNGMNLIDLAKRKVPQVTVKGNVTFSCAEPVFVAVTFNGPKSFLSLPGPTESHLIGTSIRLQFRTWNEAGLLLTFNLPMHSGAVWLYLSNARLHLLVHKAGRARLELSAGSALNDGQWHSVALNSRKGRLTVTADEDEGGYAHARPPFLIVTGSQLFFGGCPVEGNLQECENPFSRFQGCMRLLAVDRQSVDLIKVQQRLMGNYSDLQTDTCGIIDRCSRSRCEHGGHCSQSWSNFHCNCTNTGYSGATCHSSIYEQSCEAYKHRGRNSGYYFIDMDGSGPIRPQLLYCNMTEDKTWTVVEHNNTEPTKVRPQPGTNQLAVHFEYASEAEQLAAIISQSEHCEQELIYHCRRSRIFNSPDGPPFSWWVGGPNGGQVQTYWGGAPQGSRQCSCGLQQNCVDPKHQCNCDADRNEWASDSGFLTHKETLPVRSLVLGDVHRPGSESIYRLGPLQCHGDKNIWNAAFFDKETSYLHFPTFHGELSADISFLFKTTSFSGVFLENLGIKDFIRIELSSPLEVLFSFDVGNGPLEVRAKSSVPLNDNRWHRVRAERNIKEALLRLDELPAATQEAPSDGHIHLQLNSQLFIGGTASRQKGFRGCIRSLQLNGVTLDLEARAKVTPGVQAGCPGYCSSYGALCQNWGRCVEGTRSFSCDCGPSAYSGAFCEREVSAIFKSGTSLSYSLHSSSILSDGTLRGENVSLSFRTNQSPALLLYVGSYQREYLALLLNKNEQVEVRYRLDGSRDAEILRSKVRNLANGHLHAVTINRWADTVFVQVDENDGEDFTLTSDAEFNAIRSLVLGRILDSTLDPELAQLGSLGFTGCLSSVLFNTISPLKAALLHPNTSSVAVIGPLTRSVCGSTAANLSAAETTHHLSGRSGSIGTGQPPVNTHRRDSVLIGGLISSVIFVGVSALAITTRIIYRRKEANHSRAVNVVKCGGSSAPALNGSRNSLSDNQKDQMRGERCLIAVLQTQSGSRRTI
ncbi:contactin-associated protein-like 4 [Takifugu rubripes]|uniref:Contactin-associated protein-like 4 n=1 Tax=Takifugu rubripes TaxID=31033 RepID=A0A674P7F5_TAKRU|nr:contactin-associated protein-like 4 [Takifugu rubripes]